MYQDELGLDYTCNHSDSPLEFSNVLEMYLASHNDTMPELANLLRSEPEMPMALLTRAYILKLGADPRFRVPIRACYEALIGRDDLNPREQLHLAALDLWQQEQLDATSAAFDAIVTRFPKDMLALRVAHYLHFYGKGAGPMMTSLDSVRGHWDESDRFYGYLKGMQAFALEESGRYEKAELAGREALEINAADIWAAHAVTHVFQMQQRFDEGVPFIESLVDNWQDANNFVNHLHWHNALQHIGKGDLKRALNIYDEQLVAPIQDDFYLDLCNSTSLLWRLAMLGVDVGNRWQYLAELSRNRVTDDELVFTTLHYLMVPAILQDTTTINRCLEHFNEWASMPTTQGEVSRRVGQTMAEAITLFGSHKYAEGVQQMQSVKEEIHQIGGSHAQRQLFNQLIDYHQSLTS
jgi:tetratricopeptide (TPR) repeat protein